MIDGLSFLDKDRIQLEDRNIALAQTDSITQLKEKALLYSANNKPEDATTYILKYVNATGDLSIINDHVFENIIYSEDYLNIKNRFRANLNPISILYLFAGFLGFFVFVVLMFKKEVDRVSTLLIGLFILFHSLFLLHFILYVINVEYQLPHSLYISTTFSFLYGPLLYFYFKRIIFDYKFRWIDSAHLIPSIFLFLYILPYYQLSGLEKFQIMFGQTNMLLPGGNVIVVGKIISLSIYAILVVKMYRNFASTNGSKLNKNKVLWQRNIIFIFAAYVISYVFYAGTITELIDFPGLMHLQMLVMVSLVFYVAYVSYVQPEVFKGKVVLANPSNLFKYTKSRLTPSYSTELKQTLLRLLDQEKIYKMNNLNLELLSERLGTNRHNASQVINEHFNMNFFELINSYRIKEALRILENDSNNSLNIIEVAYEVGFNNKVTFNKSFKKILSQTPTQYLNTLRAVS